MIRVRQPISAGKTVGMFAVLFLFTALVDVSITIAAQTSTQRDATRQDVACELAGRFLVEGTSCGVPIDSEPLDRLSKIPVSARHLTYCCMTNKLRYYSFVVSDSRSTSDTGVRLFVDLNAPCKSVKAVYFEHMDGKPLKRSR